MTRFTYRVALNFAMLMSPTIFTGILYALVIGNMVYKRGGGAGDYHLEKQLTLAFLLVWLVYTYVCFVRISILTEGSIL